MYYVGIDIAKQIHYASIMNSDGEILVEPFPFSNDHAGFQKFLKHLSSFSQDDILIGIESTAHYAENLTSFLFTRGLTSVSLILSKHLLYESQTFIKQKRIMLIPISSLKPCLLITIDFLRNMTTILCNKKTSVASVKNL